MSVTALTTSELTVLSAALVRAMPALVRAMPALDAAELRLAVAVYHELATGEPVSLERLATRVGLAAGAGVRRSLIAGPASTATARGR